MGRQRARLATIAIALLVGIGLAAWAGISTALSGPIERVAIINLARLPPDTKPIRIALLSDIHVGNFVMRPGRLAGVVAQVNRAHPDIVLLAGDFVIGETKDGVAERAKDLAPLAGLRARGGVFAVLGNHDHWTDADVIRSSLAKAGIVILENAAVRRGAIAIVGIGDRFSGHDDIARSVARAASVGGVPIAFTHSPDLSPDLPRGFPLLLAGHTHCGQMVLPVVGPIVRYSRGRRLYDQRYRCGRIDEADRITIVTAGVGSGALPLRFNAMPDWWLIEVGPLAMGDGKRSRRLQQR